MIVFIIRRIIQAFIVILIVSMVVFCLVHFLPGDPVLIFMSEQEVSKLTAEQIEATRQMYGLDRPLIAQYFSWLKDMFTGNMGKSLFYSEDVAKLMAERIPVTLHLGISAFILSSILGIAAGTISALRRASLIDTILTFLANIGICVPIFWLGILLIYLFGLKFHFLPIYGYTSPFEDFWMSMKQTVLPVICMSITTMASKARLSRSSILEVIRQDYIRTAYSKGLRERTVVFRHVLKNGFIPIITLLGLSFSHIIGGSVLIETVFAIPGVGSLAVDGLFNHDYSIIQSITLLTSSAIVFINLAVDILYGYLDPRIRYK